MIRADGSVNRRSALCLLLFAALAGSLPAREILGAEQPSIVFIREVMADLFAAHKLGTISAFLPSIQ